MNTDELVDQLNQRDNNARTTYPFDLGLQGRTCKFASPEGELLDGTILNSFLSNWPMIIIEARGQLYVVGLKRIQKLYDQHQKSKKKKGTSSESS